MATPHGTKQSQQRARGIGLVLYSLLFLGILGFGWYHLLYGTMHQGLVAVIAALAALLAWFIAKIIGGHKEGIRGDLPLFIFLLGISAIGVFNTLMLKLEGKTIYVESIDAATRQYTDLPLTLRTGSGNKEADAKRARIEALKVQLAQEIANPRNCGDGPKAREILDGIKAELPTFTRLSGNNVDCSQNKALIRSYNEQIDELLAKSPEFAAAHVGLYNTVQANSAEQIAKLNALKKQVDSGLDLHQARNQLEVIAANYAEQTTKVRAEVPSVMQDDRFKPALDIQSARNIGEWGHLLPLMLSRLDKIQTWVYLGIAVFLDWLLVHMFARLAEFTRNEEDEFDRRDDPRGSAGGFSGGFGR
ncbi:hypothetical protein V3390_02455 [Luteimonas sp. FXH3W]|uniref:DUF4407 domain-containing protein n=1 Tax=Aquilutibacter rugosus TaxID=3115820 RepID=A0ABU7UX34_9GAMM